MPQITQRQQEGVQIVELEGEAGAAEAFEVGAVVGRLIELRPEKIIFDLGRLSFISSLALGELARLANELARYESRVALAGMSPRIQEVLRVLRFEQYYELFPTLAAALAEMRQPAAQAPGVTGPSAGAAPRPGASSSPA